MSNKMLYDNQVYFKLVIDGIENYIGEPGGWSDVQLAIERDDENLGFFVEYIPDDFTIKFLSDDIGYDLIDSLIEKYGQDAQPGFKFGYIDSEGNENDLIPDAIVNLNKYTKGGGEITASIERQGFDNKYRTRYESNISLSDTKTLDNEYIVPPSPVVVNLHSKKLAKEFRSQTTTPEAIDSTDQELARFCSLILDTSIETTDELSGNQGLPLSMNGGDPADQNLFFFQIAEAGEYTFRWQANFHFTIKRHTFGKVGNYSFQPRLIVRRAGVEILRTGFQEQAVQGNQDNVFPAEMDVKIDVSYANADMRVGDQIFFDWPGICQYAGTRYDYFVSNYTSDVQVKGLTTAPASTCNAYRVFDVLNKMLESATGQQNALISSFFDVGGCGYRYVITNGYQIRRFFTDNKPVIATLKIIESLCSLFGLSPGITKRGNDNKLVIEPFSYFYQNKMVAKLDNIYDYTEANADKLVFNQIEVGYSDTPDSDLNTLDEFNTQLQAQTPIVTYSAKFSKISDLVGSGYILESQRREQFKDNPSTSLSYDDKLFIISTVGDGNIIYAEKNESFPFVQNLISPETAYNLRITPKRILYNWSPFINICLWAKLDNQIIKTTFFKNNGDLQSELDAEDDCRRFEPLGPLTEKNDEIMGIFNGAPRTKLHLPVWANFKAYVPFDFINSIRNSMMDINNNQNKYGYILHPDEDGVYWLSFIYNFTYALNTGVGEFKVAKIKMLGT